MPNVKFSGFSAITSVGANGFLVGYDSVTNLNTRITLANLKSSIGAFTLDQTLAAGGTLTANRTINLNTFILNTTPLGFNIDPVASIASFGSGQIGLEVGGTNGVRVGDQTSNYIEINYNTGNTKFYAGTLRQFTLDFYDQPFPGLRTTWQGGFDGIDMDVEQANYSFGSYNYYYNPAPSYGYHFLKMSSYLIELLNKNPTTQNEVAFITDTLVAPGVRTNWNGVTDGLSINYTSNDYLFGYLNTSTAQDTYFKIEPDTIQAVHNGTTNGLKIDFANKTYSLGDYNGINNLTKILVDDDNKLIETYIYDTNAAVGNKIIQTYSNLKTEDSGGANIGFNINYASPATSVGYMYSAGNQDTYIRIEPNYLRTFFAGVTGDGLDFDYINQLYKFGGTSYFIKINAASSVIETSMAGAIGFYLDATNNVFQFGDWQNINNNTNITIDNGIAAKITLQSDSEMYLDDNGTGNMISGTASGFSGDHLVINVNGVQYKIKLENP